MWIDYINGLIQGKTPVRIWTLNGFQMHGLVKGYDDEAIYLEEGGKIKMIYHHAISTIAPDK